MVLRELPQPCVPRRGPIEEHRERPSPAVREVQQQRRTASLQKLWHGPPGEVVSMPTVDIHSHFFPESWPDFSERFGTSDWPWLKHLGGGEGMVMLGDR